VATSGARQIPTILLQQSDQLPDLHLTIIWRRELQSNTRELSGRRGRPQVGAACPALRGRWL